MRILIAEDDPVSRRLLETILRTLGHDYLVTDNGAVAWTELQREDAPPLAIVDWMMPEMSGIELCRRVRELPKTPPTYILLVTSQGGKENTVAGLKAGANDYVVKPFDVNELRARIQVAERMVQLQNELAVRIKELEHSLAHVKRLQGLLPMCAYCRKVRDDRNYWQEVETYFLQHTEIEFSHGICPHCRDREMARFHATRRTPVPEAPP